MDMLFKAVRLLVDDYHTCLRFYRDVLGFEPHHGDENTVIVDFGVGSERTMLALLNRKSAIVADDENQITGRDKMILVFRVSAVDEVYRRLKDRGVQFLSPPQDVPELETRAAQFRDPDGNLLEINERLEI